MRAPQAIDSCPIPPPQLNRAMHDDATTAAPKVIGEAKNYDELLALLKRRRDQLHVSLETVDALSGLPSGYSAAPTKIRALGPVSLPLLLGALALRLLVAVDPEQYERIRKRLNSPPEAIRAYR